MRVSRLAEAHVEETLRQYRSRPVAELRALPPHGSLPEFRVGKKVWTVSFESTNLGDGGVFLSIAASREVFLRWTYASGFVMDPSGHARDLTHAERCDLT